MCSTYINCVLTTMSHNKISKQDCISGLLQAREILGKSPTVKEYQQLDVSPSIPTITKRFGTWNNAKEVAGLTTNKWPQDVLAKGSPDNLDFTESEWKGLSRQKRNQMRKQSIVAKRKMESGCVNCGYNKHPSALDFHHTNENKDDSISSLSGRGESIEKIENEIEKCVVLCANCHRIEGSSGHYK